VIRYGSTDEQGLNFEGALKVDSMTNKAFPDELDHTESRRK
jgi:hypothetical protein